MYSRLIPRNSLVICLNCSPIKLVKLCNPRLKNSLQRIAAIENIRKIKRSGTTLQHRSQWLSRRRRRRRGGHRFAAYVLVDNGLRGVAHDGEECSSLSSDKYAFVSSSPCSSTAHCRTRPLRIDPTPSLAATISAHTMPSSNSTVTSRIARQGFPREWKRA